MPLRHPTRKEFDRSGLPGNYFEYNKKNPVRSQHFPHLPFLFVAPREDDEFGKLRLPGLLEEVKRRARPGDPVEELNFSVRLVPVRLLQVDKQKRCIVQRTDYSGEGEVLRGVLLEDLVLIEKGGVPIYDIEQYP